MNMKQLPYIMAIAQTGSLSAAAAMLGVSQPALSKYIAGLEQTLSIKLFYSVKKRLYPTNAGQVYLDAARRILELQEQTLHSIRKLNGEERKQLYIGGTPHRGAQMIAQIYPSFSKRFPNTELVPVEGYARQLREYVREGRVSLAITTRHAEDGADLRIVPLFDEELVLSVPVFNVHAKNALDGGEELPVVDLADFRDAPFVMMGEGTSIGSLGKRLFAEAGFSPTAVYTSDNMLMVDRMIKAGTGVGLIPLYYATASNEVVYFRLSQPCCITTCVLIQPDHALTDEERYIVYLQLNEAIMNSQNRFHWNDTVLQIIDEFEDVPPLPGDLISEKNYGY